MSTAAVTSSAAGHQARALPPVLDRLLRGSFWLALRTPLQAIFAFWSVPLIIRYIGPETFGAYGFAWGFGFIQFLLEFGMSSALQRQVSDCWTRGDRTGVNRAIACGTTFYAVLAIVQAAALVGIALFAVPHSGYAAAERRLVLQLLLLQAVTAPCYGFSTVINSVLQAARRYDFIPRLEILTVTARFLILVVGLKTGVSFFAVVAAQVVFQLLLLVAPALWVMVRELGFTPHFRGASWAEFRVLLAVSAYVFLIQLSVVLADRMDTTVLGFALPRGVAGPATAIYQVVSKPFAQIRQMGWMLTYLVMPAVASLAAAGARDDIERLKYDGSRFLIGLLLPITLLAALDAGPFLALWVGSKYTINARLLRLFLIATAPMGISVLVQMSIGLGRVRFIALAALGGAVVNLPLSYILTVRLGSVAGVIWGTVLTTLFSNLLLPGWYTFRTLDVKVATFVHRTLAAPSCGAAALVLAALAARWPGFQPGPFDRTADKLAVLLPVPVKLARGLPFLFDLSLGSLAYLAGYALAPHGWDDLKALWAKLRRK